MTPQDTSRVLQHTYGVAKLVEGAAHAPPHKPRTLRAHLADEYADLAAHARDVNAGHHNKQVAEQLRRGLSKRIAVINRLTVIPRAPGHPRGHGEKEAA